jgi:hypothetical protein
MEDMLKNVESLRSNDLSMSVLEVELVDDTSYVHLMHDSKCWAVLFSESGGVLEVTNCFGLLSYYPITSIKRWIVGAVDKNTAGLH